MKAVFLALALGAGVFSGSAWAETIELVTYYPSTANSGDLHVRSLTVGTVYLNETPGDGTVLIADKVGIGTTDPQGSLHVVGPNNQPDTVLFMPGTGTGTMRVGIGTTTPLGPLHVVTTLPDPNNDIIAQYSGTDAVSGPEFMTRRSRGTPDAPTAVQVGDDLGGMRFFGYNGTSYGTAASIDAVVQTAPVAGQPILATLNFLTNDLERLSITAAGNVGIGVTTPVSTLEVNGSLGLRTTVVGGDTALNDTHNVVLCNNGANMAVTLPAAAGVTGRTYIIKKISNNTARVTISAPATTIDGAATLVLYLWKDSVRLLCDGAGWHVISDGRAPLTAKMSRRIVQSIPGTATWVTIDFNTIDFNNGGMADMATDRFTIPRDGIYLITAHWLMNTGVGGRTGIWINGSPLAEELENPSPVNPVVADVFFLRAGDFIQMRVVNASGAAVNTQSVAQHWPRMTVSEIR